MSPLHNTGSRIINFFFTILLGIRRYNKIISNLDTAIQIQWRIIKGSEN